MQVKKTRSLPLSVLLSLRVAARIGARRVGGLGSRLVRHLATRRVALRHRSRAGSPPLVMAAVATPSALPLPVAPLPLSPPVPPPAGAKATVDNARKRGANKTRLPCFIKRLPKNLNPASRKPLSPVLRLSFLQGPAPGEHAPGSSATPSGQPSSDPRFVHPKSPFEMQAFCDHLRLA